MAKSSNSGGGSIGGRRGAQTSAAMPQIKVDSKANSGSKPTLGTKAANSKEKVTGKGMKKPGK